MPYIWLSDIHTIKNIVFIVLQWKWTVTCSGLCCQAIKHSERWWQRVAFFCDLDWLVQHVWCLVRGTARLPRWIPTVNTRNIEISEISGNPEFFRIPSLLHPSPLSAPPSPFSHKSLPRLSEDQSSCSSQINKMNFKFLLAGIWRASFSSNHNWCCCTSVFVVAVALMPTPTEADRHHPRIPGSLASLDLSWINTALAMGKSRWPGLSWV